jgi:hypothetical protein
MAISYYDEAVTQKLRGWLADSSKLRVLSPDENTRLVQMAAEDSGDKPLKLPIIAVSRNKDIELLSAIKQNKSFDGLVLQRNGSTRETVHMNVIPIKTTYQIDIYTKTRAEADEYVRQYLFKLINNPQIIIDIAYNNYVIRHTANLRVLDTISDTSDISAHLFPGQFYKWTIQLELHDGFLFSMPVKMGWSIVPDFSEETKSILDVEYSDDEVINNGGMVEEDIFDLPDAPSTGTSNNNNASTSNSKQPPWEIVFKSEFK